MAEDRKGCKYNILDIILRYILTSELSNYFSSLNFGI